MLGSAVLCSKLLILLSFCLCSLPEGQSLKNSILYFDKRKTFLKYFEWFTYYKPNDHHYNLLAIRQLTNHHLDLPFLLRGYKQLTNQRLDLPL